jgi:ubiquinone/menaquinone biosynthesis C-methylase UbiE
VLSHGVPLYIETLTMAQAETERLTEILWGAALSRAVCSVAELGIADQIEAGSPQSIDSLARSTGTHEHSLYRILRFLASHGIFQEKDNRQFDHTPLSHSLRSDAEGSFRAAGQMFHRLFPFWDGLHHSVITGEPGFNQIFKQPVFEYVGKHPELASILDAAMTAIHGHETQAMLEAYDFSGIQILADIGGGNGSLITAVLQRYPKLQGLLFELGHVVERTRENLKAKGVDNRCSVIEGNFFKDLPSGADAYLFRHVIHDWADEQSVQILSNCRRIIPKEGRLLIIEAVVPTGNEPSLAKDFDMVMLGLPGGIERTAEEYEILLKQAGFRLSRIMPTTSVISIVEGKPT